MNGITNRRELLESVTWEIKIVCHSLTKASCNLEMKNSNRKSHAIYRVHRPRKILQTFSTSNISPNLFIVIIFGEDSLSCLGKGPPKHIPIAISLFQVCERPFRVRTLGPLTAVGYSAVSRHFGRMWFFSSLTSFLPSCDLYFHFQFNEVLRSGLKDIVFKMKLLVDAKYLRNYIILFFNLVHFV